MLSCCQGIPVNEMMLFIGLIYHIKNDVVKIHQADTTKNMPAPSMGKRRVGERIKLTSDLEMSVVYLSAIYELQKHP